MNFGRFFALASADEFSRGGHPRKSHQPRRLQKERRKRGNGHAYFTEEELPGHSQAPVKFPFIAFKDVTFDLDEECRVEGIFPLVGLACIFGGPSTVKSFILQDLNVRMARGGLWGGREVKQCPVIYIAAEGAGGIKKRIAGLKKVAGEKGLPVDIPFHLITVAPNLGAGNGDCKKLIADIEAQLPEGVQPGAITVDTTQQSLGGADENGAGMDQLVVNCTAIFNHFQCLVILIHHTPVSDDERLRGKAPGSTFQLLSSAKKVQWSRRLS